MTTTGSLMDLALQEQERLIAEFKPPAVRYLEPVWLKRNPSDPRPTLGMVIKIDGRCIAVAEFDPAYMDSRTRENCYHISDPAWRDPTRASSMAEDGMMWEKIPADKGGPAVDSGAVFQQLAQLAERVIDLEARLANEDSEVVTLEHEIKEEEPKKRGPGRPRKN